MAKASQFLKIAVQDGGEAVAGDSYAHGHEGEIDLTGWHWGIVDPAVPVRGAKAKAKATTKAATAKPANDGQKDKKPQPSTFKFQKATDRSTTRLLSAMDNGEIFPEVILTIEEQFEASSGHVPFYLKVHLVEVFVMEFQWQASVESAGFTFGEDWELNYRTIHFDYNWRGGNAGWIKQSLTRRPDSTDGASEKSPPTAAEQAEARQREYAEFLKKQKPK